MSQLIPLWRLCNGSRFWDNSGAAGWWHPPGRGVIVLDSSPIAAVCAALELVEAPHPSALPRNYRLHGIVASSLAMKTIDAEHGWWRDRQAAQGVGRAWLDEGEFLMLRVPAQNGGHQYLLNTGHPQRKVCHVEQPLSYPFGDCVAQMESVLAQEVDWLAVLPQSVSQLEGS
jgi:hypothetical protein